jgi:hypothetical protein
MKTIRDTIAMQFMSAILTSARFNDYIDEANIMEAIAKDAYKMADTMIEVKGKGEKISKATSTSNKATV